MTNGAQAAMPVAVSIRPLEWTDHGDGFSTHTLVGYYQVKHDGDEPEEWSARRNGAYLNPGFFATEDGAKAAVKSHYEAWVRSALAPSDAMPMAWQVLRKNEWVDEDDDMVETRRQQGYQVRALFAHPAPSVPPPLPGEVGELVERASLVTSLRCENDMGHDREMGPIGCKLKECLCAGFVPLVRDLAKAITAQAAERDDYRESWKACMDQRAAAEAALAAAKAEVERAEQRGYNNGREYGEQSEKRLGMILDANVARLEAAEAEVERLRSGIADIEDAASSFCDESGDEVAGQIRIRARSLLGPSEEPK